LHAAEPGVRAWEGTITLPTWEEGPPDDTPRFDALSAERAWYPYPVRASLGKQRRALVWRTLHLENEYLSCMVLPDLGGRLYSCRDKLSGYEMFHANSAIKKAMIGLRGAWTALGVELNFPVGHSLLTVSPVDFRVVNGVVNGKDAASVWVGATDRVSGMRWRVEFRLESGYAALRQNVYLENPTPARHRYYWWTNASVTLKNDTRFVVPTRLIASHGLTNIDTWPVSAAGLDRGAVAAYPTGLGLFTHGSREPFLAAYHPGAQTGTLHYADPAAVPGKKIWTWGRADDQSMRALLSDDSSIDVEIQAGLFANQETYGFFAPWQERAFTEYWMAVRKLDGVSQAGLDGILYFTRKDGALVAQLLPTRVLRGARVRIAIGAAVAMETVDLDPAKVFTRSIPNPQPGHYRFELADAAGKTLLAYTEDEIAATTADAVKLGAQPQTDWNKSATPEELLARGEHRELQGEYRLAREDYALGMEKFPERIAFRKSAGRLAAGMKRFAEAETHLTAVVQATPADAEAHYYLGLTLAGQEKDEEAAREWTAARADTQFGPAAALESAALLARTGSARAAREAVRSAGSKLVRAGVIEAALARITGDAAGAKAALARVAALDPTDFVVRFEQVRENADDATLWEHLAADPERVLEVADLYMHWGLYRDALEVLARIYPPVAANHSEPGAVPPHDYALVVYYRAYCHDRLLQNAAEDFRQAAALPVRYVFPNRAGSLPVLRAAIRWNPGDATAHYLLGLLYLDSGMIEEAGQELRSAQKIRPLLGQARVLLTAMKLPLTPAPVATTAVTATPPPVAATPPPVKSTGDTRAPALLSPGIAPPASSGRSPRELAAAALRAAANGNLEQALGFFTGANFPQDKQDDFVREAYIELQLQRLLALAASRQCAAADQGLTTLGYDDTRLPFTFHGFDAFMKGARFQYLLAAVEAACVDDKSARKRWDKLAKMRADIASTDYAYPYLAAARLNPAESAAKATAGLEGIRRALAAAGEASRPALLYSQGLLLKILGKLEEAAVSFQQGSAAASEARLQYLNDDALRTLTAARHNGPDP
jgi:Flp pilus assembly protein TadD